DLTVVAEAPTVAINLDGQARGLTVEDDVEETAVPVVSSEVIRLRLVAKSKSSLIDDIQLFQNGKRLGSSTRGLFVEDDAPDGDEKVEQIDVALLPGENVFRAVAVNQLRTESAPAEISIRY